MKFVRTQIKGAAFLLLLLMVLGAAPVTASVVESSERKTVLVLGDSIAAGYGVEPEEAFPSLIEEKLNATGGNFEVVNGGISGDTTASGLRRIDWMLRRKIDVLILELGGNDGLRGLSPDETERNLQGIIDKVRKKYPSAEIVIAGMQMPQNMGEEYTTKFREIFPALAERNKTHLIPFLLEGVGGKAELNQPDRIHPTAEGHRIVAENVWKILKDVVAMERNTTVTASE